MRKIKKIDIFVFGSMSQSKTKYSRLYIYHIVKSILDFILLFWQESLRFIRINHYAYS